MNSIRSHTRTIVAIPLLATLSLAGSSLILPSGVLAASDAGDASTTHKVFVCKYVGMPGVNERLKAGQNPISVDLHTIDEYKTFDGDIDSLVGGHFADAQGRSFVIAVDRGQPEPPVIDCPSPDSGEKPSASPIETPTVPPTEAPTASPIETPTEAPTASPIDTEPNATPTPNLVVIPTPAPTAKVQAVVPTPQLTPPSTDTTSTIQADHGSNLAPVLLLLAAVTAVLTLVTPHARNKARGSR